MGISFQYRLFALAVVRAAIAIDQEFRTCSAQTICNMPASGLMACKPAATPPNPSPPTATCCSAVAHVDMRCLCSYRNSKLLPSLGIDPNLAMQIPDKCKIPHPANC